MINGKFYTGLPSEMMARSRVVNRQETNFFWPDESHMESVSSKPKRTPSKVTSPIVNYNNDTTDSTDIKPKELFRKQLTSGIEFYDNVNAKTPESRRRRFKKIDNVNLNNNRDNHFQPEKKKLETFSSKIEFYDFETKPDARNERKIKIEQPVEPMKKAVEEVIMKKESPEVNKKRISFRTETKGILKKSDGAEKVVVKPLPKRGLLPKNLSKSVENISKMAKSAVEDDIKGNKEPEKLSTIINEVKQLNLSQDRKQNYDRYEPDDDYYRRSSKNSYEPRRNDEEYSGRHSEKYETRGGYRDEPDYYRYEERKYRNDNYRNDERSPRDRDYDRYEKSPRSSQPHDDDRRYRPRKYDESPVRDAYSPPVRDRYSPDRRPYEREYERNSRKEESRPVEVKPSYEAYEKPSRNIRHEDEYSSSISRTPKQLPQHLRSNILFNGHVQPQAHRPISVRNSAVTRVGVGLPDIE